MRSPHVAPLGRRPLVGALPLLAAAAAHAQPAPRPPGESSARGAALVAFGTDTALAAFLREVARAHAARRPTWSPAPPCAATPAATVDSSATGAGPAVVRGRVRRAAPAADTAGLAGAAVTLRPLGAGASTQEGGTFEIRVPAESLPAARPVTVSVRRIGYAHQTQALTLRRGDRVDLAVPMCPAAVMLSAAVAVTGVGTEAASVTNVQHAGVDEGGIVKRHGHHLVILRRGRLFTVDVRGGRLRPVAAVDAFGPGIDPAHAWYDEMLVAGDRVVVVGFSYRRGGTELGVFRLDRAGGLRHEGTYHLRSDDYYSSRNYAARLVGSRLVFYTPLDLPGDTARPLAALPAMRRWRPAGDTGAFRPIITARRVYRPAGGAGIRAVETLHAVTTCDLAAPVLACEATVVPGPSGSVFYVSPTAVYVSAAPWRRPSPPTAGDGARPRDAAPTLLVRMPLDGSSPSALRASGSPADQFSFLERDGALHILLRADGRGGRMWVGERGSGALALLRVPLARFSDGRQAAPRAAYRPLPTPDSSRGALQNRFVGGHLLYGTGDGWGEPRGGGSTLVAVPLRGGAVTELRLPHAVDRIEALGADALVVGADTADLHLTGVRLAGGGRAPALAQRYVLPQASQGELRSHGFFYHPDADGGRTGVLGLPVRAAGEPGYAHLVDGSASVLFVRNAGGAFRPLGALPARPESAAPDGCRASCVDWYGNARPLFLGRRVLALLGYELVEGAVRGGRLEEVGRATFAPRPAGAGGR